MARWTKAVVASLTGAGNLRGTNRAEFEQVARDLDLAPTELYRLSTGRRLSADALERYLAAEFEGSPQLTRRLRAIEREYRLAQHRASMPIGPSCC